jgi:cephalosporin-C deacetylase-like acetyl esterase
MIRLTSVALSSLLCLLCSLAPLNLQAADKASSPLTVKTDRSDAIYKKGETVTFTVKAAEMPDGTELTWKISKDGVAPIRTGTAKLSNGGVTLTGTLDEPGFLLCEVTCKTNNKPVTAMTGAGFDPLEIKPSMPVPDDFDSFWAEQRKKLAQVPMNPRLTPVDATQVKDMECFDVQVDCAGGAPVSGYYVRPKGAQPKSLPILLSVHGAGVGSSSLDGAKSWCSKGFIAMDVNAHGIANGKPAEFYRELEVGRLREYYRSGKESRETFYFLGMFLRVFRAIDFLAAQPEWDGKTIVVYGSSQGAFQSFAAGLDERVSFIAAGVPAGCDHTGMMANRICGWPKIVPNGPDGKPDPKVLETSRYFDNVNFAIRTKAKGAYVTVGFIDTICPPTSVYAAYNALPVPKDIFNDLPAGHTNTPEALAARNNAVMDFVKKAKAVSSPAKLRLVN